MPFPDIERVIYKNNPLDQVICQLKFPPILTIDAEVPAIFQERIRKNFPNYNETAEWKVQIAPGLYSEVPSEIFKSLYPNAGIRNYEFSSEDGNWKINLTNSFVSLTANNYERWEAFREKLKNPLSALIDIYSPDNFTRVGLRYIDVIRPSSLQLEDYNWSDLFEPYISGILSSEQICEHVLGFENTYEVNLSDGESIVRITTKFVAAVDDGEISFSIDSDFMNRNKSNTDKAFSLLDQFNKSASRLFRWCITDQLHNAMKPTKI